LLESIQSLWRDDALDLRTDSKAEPEKLPFLRSRHRALRLIHLEFEFLHDESRNALHHPLTRPLAANINIAIVRVSNKAMSPALQLPVEFVEHEIAEQGRKHSPYTKGNFEFERVVRGWRSSVPVLDLRLKR
jgi:hypothetical protein